jgi:hypothetical protein
MRQKMTPGHEKERGKTLESDINKQRREKEKKISGREKNVHLERVR